MKDLLDLGVLLATVLMMFAVGLEMERGALGSVYRHRSAFFPLWILQWLVPPAIALLVVILGDFPPQVDAGLLLLAACPVGDLACAYTAMARGPVALCVAVNATSCLLSPATMAILFALYGLLLDQEIAFTVPAMVIVFRVFLMAAIPIAAGMLVRRVSPSLAGRMRGGVQRVCAACILFLVAYVIVSQHERVVAEWRSTAMAAFLFLGATLSAGWLTGRLLSLPGGHCATASFLCGVRNLGLMTAVAVTLMDRPEYAVFGAVYLLIEVPLALGVIRLAPRPAA